MLSVLSSFCDQSLSKLKIKIRETGRTDTETDQWSSPRVSVVISSGYFQTTDKSRKKIILIIKVQKKKKIKNCNLSSFLNVLKSIDQYLQPRLTDRPGMLWLCVFNAYQTTCKVRFEFETVGNPFGVDFWKNKSIDSVKYAELRDVDVRITIASKT